MLCEVDRDGASCRGDRVISGEPTVFEIDPTLSTARVVLTHGETTFEAEWSLDPLGNPVNVVPYPYEYYETCSTWDGKSGSGEGRGLVRRLAAEAHLFGRDLPVGKPRFVDSYVTRGYLRTTCDHTERGVERLFRSPTRDDRKLPTQRPAPSSFQTSGSG